MAGPASSPPNHHPHLPTQHLPKMSDCGRCGSREAAIQEQRSGDLSDEKWKPLSCLEVVVLQSSVPPQLLRIVHPRAHYTCVILDSSVTKSLVAY